MRTIKFLQFALVIMLVGCQKDNLSVTEDPQDLVMETVVMADGKTWTAENMDIVSVGYEDQIWWPRGLVSGVDYTKYGKLYTLEAAKEACLQLGDGWRLPTDQDWRDMTAEYGDWVDYDSWSSNAGAYENLIDGGESNFNALLSGTRNTDNEFLYLDIIGFYWSSTEKDAEHAWSYNFHSVYGKLGRYGHGKSYGLSCRCVQD